MARKRTRNRLEERADYEDDDKNQDDEPADPDDDEGHGSDYGDEEEECSDDQEDYGSEKPNKLKSGKKDASSKTKTRKASVKGAQMKVIWGVVNNSNSVVKKFGYAQEAEARAYAERLAAEKKATFFVQRIKVPLSDPID